MNVLRHFAALLLPVLLGCASSGFKAPASDDCVGPVESSQGRLLGIVTSKYGGLPNDLEVVVSPDRAEGGQIRVQPDERGRYCVRIKRNASYRVETRSALAPTRVQFIQGETEVRLASELGAFAWDTGCIAFSIHDLPPSPADTRDLYGTAITVTGAPVEGACVEVTADNGRVALQPVFTDSAGAFAVKKVPGGKARVTVSAETLQPERAELLISWFSEPQRRVDLMLRPAIVVPPGDELAAFRLRHQDLHKWEGGEARWVESKPEQLEKGKLSIACQRERQRRLTGR